MSAPALKVRCTTSGNKSLRGACKQPQQVIEGQGRQGVQRSELSEAQLRIRPVGTSVRCQMLHILEQTSS